MMGIRDAILHFWAEKSVHLVLFSILALLLWKSFANRRGKPAWILLAGTSAGCASEILQRFFPGRDPALRDVGFDIAGTIAGIIIASLRLPEFSE
jgi:VanZ family protein